MKVFGVGINHEFSEAEETCIMISFDEIYDVKVDRHIKSFFKEKMEKIRERFPAFFEDMGDNLSDMIASKRQQVQSKIEARRSKRKKRRK